MATMRELKGRINSVHSSQKITGAMKMISSARLRKAENKLLQAEPYRRKLWEIYAHIEKSGCEFQSPLTVKRQVKKVAIVIFASDDGLCGAFNINLYKIGGGSTGLSETGYPGNYRFSGRKKNTG